MAISDTYVIQYVLQATCEGEIAWEEKESDGYAANRRGVRLELDRAPSSTCSRLFLTLSRDAGKVHIAEPLSTGFFRERYQNDAERHLAVLLRDLAAAITRQCRARKAASIEGAEVVREGIYRRLIGASGV